MFTFKISAERSADSSAGMDGISAQRVELLASIFDHRCNFESDGTRQKFQKSLLFRASPNSLL